MAGGWAPAEQLAVSDPDDAQRDAVAAAHPGVAVHAEPVAADGAVLAVKPDVAEGACRTLGAVGIPRILSVVAGLAAAAPRSLPCRRHGGGPFHAEHAVAGRCGRGRPVGGSNATSADLDWAEGILAAVGTVVRLPERQLDAVTGLSGSGPAYMFMVAEALIEAGVVVGLPRDVSRTLVVATLPGSAKLLRVGGGTGGPAGDVTSPGGTTAAGLRVLEAKAVRSAFIEAVAAATERSRQLGR